MSLMILYRNPKRPHEAGTTMIAGQTEARAAIDRLERRGFIVDKITFAPFARGSPLRGSPNSRG